MFRLKFNMKEPGSEVLTLTCRGQDASAPSGTFIIWSELDAMKVAPFAPHKPLA
jgi:hypothetical protein